MKNSYQNLSKQGFGLVALLTGLMLACSNPGKSGSSAPVKAPEENKSTADARPIIPTPADTGSLVIVNFKNPAGLKNLTGYVVDAIDAHGFKAVGDVNGRYALYSMKPGRYDIIFEAQRAADDASQSVASHVGIRLSGITVKAGEDFQIKEEINLLPSFAVTGKVHLLDGVTHGAIAVQIPGTKIKAATDAEGNFTLDRVPTGKHSVVALNPGFIRGSYETRDWPQASNTLPNLTLLPEEQAVPTGVHYKGEGIVANEPNQVTLFLVNPNGMNKYRLSETSDFADAKWQDFQSAVDVNFPVGGERRIFVQYAKEDQQFSAIFSVDIPMTPK